MINDVTKKYRDVMAFGLLASAALAVIAALSLLFKSGDDLGGDLGFPEKSALYGTHFESLLITLALVGAVVLVTRLGELSANARIVVLAAMGIGAVTLLFAVITFFAQFGANSGFVNFAGSPGAGKIVGAFLSLAQLSFLGVGLLYIVTAFQSLPTPAPVPTYAQPWAAGPGYGQYPGQNPGAVPGQQAWRQPEPGPGQQPWGQPGWGQQAWTQPAAAAWPASSEGPQQGWGQPSPGQAPPPPAAAAWPPAPPSGWGQQPGYGQPASAVPAAARTEPEAAEAPAEPAQPTGPAEPAEGAQSTEAAENGPEGQHAKPVTDETAAAASEDDGDGSSSAQGWWQHPGR